MSRISKTEYGLLLALTASARSEDPNTKVGCALENHSGRIIALGYNGLKEKQTASSEILSNRDIKRQFFIHAETNALSLIKKGEAETIYISHSPCEACCQNIASHAVNKVVFLKEHIDYKTGKPYSNYKEILNSYGIKVIHYKNINNDLLKEKVERLLN